MGICKEHYNKGREIFLPSRSEANLAGKPVNRLLNDILFCGKL
jgi:hypothetical protein